jgi:hypothetical protein
MLGVRYLFGSFAAAAFVVAALVAAQAGTAPTDGIMPDVVPVKLGLDSMSATDRQNLWKMVDEYATVDALQEFCGIKLNLQRRAWRAVSSCVEVKSLRRVISVFAKKKADYLKAWQTLHGEEANKKLVCDRFKVKLGEYAKIISGQIAEAASMCRNCFFC